MSIGLSLPVISPAIAWAAAAIVAAAINMKRLVPILASCPMEASMLHGGPPRRDGLRLMICRFFADVGTNPAALPPGWSSVVGKNPAVPPISFEPDSLKEPVETL